MKSKRSLPMTDILAPSAAPTNALLIWTDGRRVFVELPSPNSPVVLAYSYTDGGLSKALALLGAHKVDYACTPILPGRKLLGTANQHDSAQRALARLGHLR